MAISSSLALCPLRFDVNANDLFPSSRISHLFYFSTYTTTRPSSTITFSYSYILFFIILYTISFLLGVFDQRPELSYYLAEPGTVLAAESKKQLLERYGLDPNDYLSVPKTKRRKEVQKGVKEMDEENAAKLPRTTHKLLQVIGGKAKRKKLLSPKGMDVRPMMEVVKRAVFDILQAAGGCPASLRSGRWLDLYSGTGSVGIEAISRGCSEAHFVEMDPWVVSNVLQPNLQWTGFLDVSMVHTVRVEKFLERAYQFAGASRPFDYISVTPPYTEVDYGVLMGQISKSTVVGEDSFIVVEYPLRADMLDSCGCLVKITDRRFGRTHLAIYGPKWAQKKRN